MTLKKVAVQGMTVTIDATTETPPGASVAGAIAVAPPTGTKAKAEAKLIHRDGDQITVSGITAPGGGAITPDPGSYTVPLNATATKTKAEGTEVLRVDDQSDTINAVPVIPGSPPVNYPVSFKCVISDPGQAKVKAQ